MTDIKCLDSSAWLAYHFATSPDIKEIIDKEGLIITSSLCLFEIKKRLLVLNKDWQQFLKFVKERSGIIVPEIEIAEKANEKGHLFASIHADAIAAELKKQKRITLLSEFLVLPKPIKEIGEYAIVVTEHNVTASFTLVVKPSL